MLVESLQHKSRFQAPRSYLGNGPFPAPLCLLVADTFHSHFQVVQISMVVLAMLLKILDCRESFVRRGECRRKPVWLEPTNRESIQGHYSGKSELSNVPQAGRAQHFDQPMA